MSGNIHVALCFDGSFWAPAYAVMRSVCLTTRRRADLVFHLAVLDISDQRIARLREIEAEFGAKLMVHDLTRDARFAATVATLPMTGRLHKVIYARMLLDAILPAGLGRVIYLDCDTLVLAPIEALWEVDLEGRTLGAVADGWALFNMAGRDAREKRDVFDTAAPYFNSGVLVVDLVRLAHADVPGRLKTLEAEGRLAKLYYDQDMLNLIFAGDWTSLDWRWNVIDPRQAHQALHPAILHYTGKARPWALTAGIRQSVAFARLYRHVMTNAVFYDFARERRGRWLRKRLGLRR